MCISRTTLVLRGRSHLIGERGQQVSVRDHTQRHDFVQYHPGRDLVVLDDGREVFPEK